MASFQRAQTIPTSVFGRVSCDEHATSGAGERAMLGRTKVGFTDGGVSPIIAGVGTAARPRRGPPPSTANRGPAVCQSTFFGPRLDRSHDLKKGKVCAEALAKSRRIMYE